MTKTLSVFFAFISLFAACYREQAVPVSVRISFQVVDSNYAAPALVKIINNTEGAESYNWTFEGASPSSSTKKDPGTIEYSSPGTYKIVLEAANPNGGHDRQETEVRIDAPVRPGFTLLNKASSFSPVTYQVENTTEGASWFQWTFEGGTPSSSNLESPGEIIFSSPGSHSIYLKAGNDRVSYVKDTVITVQADLVADFVIKWPAEDDDMEVPFTAMMINKSSSATDYSWSFPGASPISSSDSSPVVTYNAAGTYNITLTAKNDKKTESTTKTITLKPNSNLFRFQDIALGINTAQDSIGCYFSSSLGKVIRGVDVTTDNGGKIDFAFFGLNSSFDYNKIISPDSVGNYTFAAIPGAINLQVINKQEDCNCGIALNESTFDAMEDDTWFQSASIQQTNEGAAQFDDSVTPRIILFQTSDGRKGAVKIKQFVSDGLQSYVLCDIRMMKEG